MRHDMPIWVNLQATSHKAHAVEILERKCRDGLGFKMTMRVMLESWDRVSDGHLEIVLCKREALLLPLFTDAGRTIPQFSGITVWGYSTTRILYTY